MFNVEQFLQQTTDQAMSTQYVNVPEGWWPAVASSVTARQITQGDGQERLLLDISWGVDSDKVREATHREKPLVRQTVFLDGHFTMDGGFVMDGAPGANVQLGRLRETLGQNRPGVSWAPSQIVGVAADVFVEHSQSGDRTFANVTALASCGTGGKNG